MIAKDTKLSDLTVEEFSHLMLSVMKTGDYLNAQKEQELANQIFADANGIIVAAVPPFRARTAQDVREFAKSIEDYIKAGGTGVFVLAAALVDETGYRRL